MTRFFLLLMPALLCGCALRGDDTVEPPAELESLEATLEIARLWSTKVGKPSERLRLGLQPATDGARIYAASHNGRVAALDAESGRRQWVVDTELPLAAGPSFGSGLLVAGTTDGDLVAFDASNGEQRWKVQVGSEVLAPPAVNRNVVVYRTVDGRLRGADPASGATLWSVEQSMPALTLRGNTAPYVVGQVVVCGFDNGRVGAYQLNNGDPIWELTIAAPTGRNELERLVDISAGIQVVGNDVYTAGYQGRAVGLDLRTGEVLWQQQLSSFAGLGADINSVYVTTDVDAVVALDRQGGRTLWRQEALRLRDLTAPARHREAVVVGDYEGYLHWLSPDDGRFLGRARAASGRILGAPLIIGLNVFVQAEDGTVAAFTVVDEAREL